MGNEVNVRRLLLLLAILCAPHAQGQWAAVADAAASADNDSFESFRIRSGAMFRYGSPFEYSGVALQTTRYAHTNWTENAPGVVFLHRRQRPDTLEGTLAEAGLVRINDRIRPIGDATWSIRPNARTGVELIAAADLVETRRALEDATAYTFAGASLERQLTTRFTVIGLAGYQHFTDDNARVHARARAIWSIDPERGIRAELRWRGFMRDETDVSRPYFDPRRYAEWEAAVAVRRRLAGWMVYGAVAAGRESVSGADQRTTGSAELRAEGPLPRDMRLAVHVLFDRSAGFAVADEYRYGRAAVMLIVPF